MTHRENPKGPTGEQRMASTHGALQAYSAPRLVQIGAGSTNKTYNAATEQQIGTSTYQGPS